MVLSSDYYDEDYFTKQGCKGWYNKHAFMLEQPFHLYWACFIINSLEIGQRANVLDLGCARGNVVHWLREYSINGFGVDISQWSIGNRHCEYCIRSDIISIPFKKNTFDFVVCREVIEHIDCKLVNKVFNDVRRVLKKNGIFLLSPATNRGRKEDIKQRSNNADISHICIRTPYQWSSLLEDSGFTILYKETFKINSMRFVLFNNWDIIVCKK